MIQPAQKIKQSRHKKKIDSDFKRRLDAHLDKLIKQFYALYERNGQARIQLDRLIEVLENGFENRSSELLTLDQQREKDPHWYLSEKWVGMMLYTDRFAGDLKGLEKKIPYLDDIGVNLLHLMPLLKAPKENNDGGYAVSDYRKVDDRVGSMKDLNKLTRKLHQSDKLLMLDFVLNHTSNEHEWAKKAKSGDQKYQDYFYFQEDRTIVNLFEHSLPEVFPESSPGNFTYIEEVNKWVMTVFNDYQWDLNYTNPDVFIEMVDVMIFLANQGIDILRLDALAFLWKKMGTDSQNLDEAHLIIKTMKSCMNIVAPGTLFLAEAIVAPHEIIKYFGDGDECEMAYNATFMVTLWDAIATKNNRLLLTTLNNIPQKPFGATWLNYARCHDDIGLGYDDQHARWSGYDPASHRRFLTDFLIGRHPWSFAKGMPFMENEKTGDARIAGSLASLAGLEKALEEKDERNIEFAIRRILMLHSFILTYGGIPMLYAGDELATLNDYSYCDDPAKADDSRWLHRPKMDWAKLEKIKKSEKPEARVFQGLKRMISLRKSSPEMAALNNRIIADLQSEHLLGYIRSLGASHTLIISNLNDSLEILNTHLLTPFGFDPREAFMDKLSEESMIAENGQLVLEPYATLWLTQTEA